MNQLKEENSSLRGMKILVRGAGEMASGVVHRLARSGFRVLMTETEHPLAVRRAVSFCEAVHDGSQTVEGLCARLIDSLDQAPALWEAGDLPVLVDPDFQCLAELQPAVVLDAAIAKRNLGMKPDMARLTIAMGPGFSAPEDVDLVLETNRGHNLGRLIYKGRAAANTGVPGVIGGFTHERVLRSPAEGVFEAKCELGDLVEKDQVVAVVAGAPVRTQLAGVIRGLIRPGAQVKKGLKVGDVDPRGNKEYLYTISEKARALGGSALEGILAEFNC